MNSHVKNILNEVADKHGVTVANILSPARQLKIVNARHEVFYRLHEERRYSAERIALIFGHVHTSIYYAVSRHAFVNGLPTRIINDYYHKAIGHSAEYAKRRRALQATHAH